MLYFFLSYAREDDPDYIRRFFHDLSGQVRNLAGVGRTDAVGFLDEQSVQIGQRWSAELSDALGSCSCFVAMTSPRYFRRDYCGREWSVFNDRLVVYEQQWNRSAPALMPVRWIPTTPMHPLAAEIQSVSSEITDEPYRRYGLRQMLDLKRFRDDYLEFVFDLARVIVEVADSHRVPRRHRRIQLNQVPNIFATPVADDPGRSGGAAGGQRRRSPARLSARTFVRFIVIAGTRENMSALRDKVDYYGDSARDWAPYRPILEDTLADYATQIAGNRLFDSEIGDVSHLAASIENAKKRNELVVLLVDAWSSGLPEHRHALSEYDTQDEVASAIIIPFNSSDVETLSETTVLQAQLSQVLRRRLERRDRIMLRQNVPTPEQFGTDLEEILEVAQNRIFKRGSAKVAGRSSRSRPILEGPTSSTDRKSL